MGATFQNWTQDMSRQFGSALTLAQHRLHESALFNDDALVELVRSHPRDYADFCIPSQDAAGADKLSAGDLGDVDPAALIEAVRGGRMWINLRRAVNFHPSYRAMIDEAFAELKSLTPHFRPTHFVGGILISGPEARVPYHADKTDVLLWHVRGRKRVFVYPNTAPFLKDEDMETLILDEALEDLPYERSYDAGGRAIDLEPGEMLSWPLHSPHRVENLEGLNVSVTVEYSSIRSALSNGVFYSNAVMRRRFGMNPSSRANPVEAAAKLGMSRVFKKLGWGDSVMTKREALPEADIRGEVLRQAA